MSDEDTSREGLKTEYSAVEEIDGKILILGQKMVAIASFLESLKADVSLLGSISFRDEAAIAAMQSLIIVGVQQDRLRTSEIIPLISEHAFAVSDAMQKEREKRGEK